MVCNYCRLLVEQGWLRVGDMGDEKDSVFFGTIPNSDILVSLVQFCIIFEFYIF